jgi:adenosylcobinamide-GDP ribazoletransferase
VVLSGLRGAVGFLTRVPVGHDERAWEGLAGRPALFVPVGYAVGAVAGLALAAPLPTPTAALLYPLALVALTGINHADGLADLGDAAVVHGGPGRRREVMADTTVGVGAAVAVGLALLGLGLGALAAASLSWRVALGLAIASEVAAKLAMAVLAAAGEASHEGLGSAFTGASTGSVFVALGLAAPAAAATWPSPAAAAAVAAGPVVALLLLAWARRNLGGVNGDVFGAANELARVAALHAGVVAWTLS